MTRLNQLRQQRAKLNDRNADLTAMMKNHPDDPTKRTGKLTDEQIDAEFTENETKIKELDGEIKIQEEKDAKWQARMDATADRASTYSRSAGTSAPVTTGPEDEGDEDEDEPDEEGDGESQTRHRGGATTARRVGGQRRTDIRVRRTRLEPGIALAKIIRAHGAINQGRSAVAKQILDGVPEALAAMEAGNFTTGGFLTPENYVAEVIELLRPITVMLSMGVTQAPLVNGTLTMPKITAGTSAAYVGESVNIPISGMTGGQVKATAHKLAVIVPVSNELLRFATPSADTLVRNDMLRAMAQARDAAWIRDDGAGNAPKGIRYWIPATHIETATGGGPTIAQVDANLNSLISNLLVANVFAIPRRTGFPQSNAPTVEIGSVGWIFSPRTWTYLKGLRDTNGNMVYPEMDEGMLKGFPYAVTSTIPENLGGGSDETEIYFGAFSDVVVAMDPRVEIEASNTAAYHDGSQVQAAFSLDQTVIRCLSYDDLVVRNDVSLTMLSAVDWGT
jgi:HK97 family phage major capsid protein